jgi:hypothetical protein
MSREIAIDAAWEEDAHVWLATSHDAPGLVVEADSWDRMISEVRLALPDLLALNGAPTDDVEFTFRAETRLALARV